MISKTKIKRRIKRKKNKEIAETLSFLIKCKPWKKIAQKLSGPNRKYSSINLKEINEISKEGDTILVAGKILGKGNLDKKIRLCAIYFSKSAEEKIKAIKGEAVTILEEVKKNPKMEGIKVLE